MLEEELLSVWLRLTSVIDNQRLAVSRSGQGGEAPLPFNEAMVCGLLVRAQEEGCCLTASDLCRETRILKSQMNAILRSLERKGILSRRRSEGDRRRIELELLPEGMARYQEGHQRIQRLASRLISEMGEENILTLLPLLRQAADSFDAMQQEVT
ncbi:MAG: MarR family winged helix-turn-helix transcriptional regulator [Oscillospiraceae bacterium]|nr:MarR family winged helix-turn-helix transcriptional regulator [Oscillospiraceae bacterium]MDE7041783.1 MarR family winged helix-turn-helix transcriptional regulator [Oscillospiraceae bacterium]